MSLDQYTNHFFNNGSFVSQLLVTVDGGGDELQSLAEGDSKYHSVERLHTAENNKIDAYVPPKTMDWVFNPDFESMIKNFFGKTASYQMENNFVIKPSGSIWGKL
ncbi:hypothetical protein ACJMK2_017282, partial [Sinanodonta woodiana]